MTGGSSSLDFWRRFFGNANADIFEVIEKAIIVAASDHPEEFLRRRDRIAERLYTQRRADADGAELRLCREDDEEDGRSKRDYGNENKANEQSTSGRDEKSNRPPSNYSYEEAEALTDEIEEENQILGEVLRIKELLQNHRDESDGVLFESLRRLQLMRLSVETLQATEIGKAVNGLRRHNSKQIRHLVRTLIEGWKSLVDQWVNATAAITDGTPDSVLISAEDEEDEGLAFPPLDEGALLATQTTSIELSKIFDGMDDDGNLQASHGQHEKLIRRPPQKNLNAERKQPPPSSSAPPIVKGHKTEAEAKQRKPQDTRSRQINSEPAWDRQSRPSGTNNELGRFSKPTVEQKSSSLARPLNRVEPVSAAGQRKPPYPVQERSRNSDDAFVHAKMEITKRKLQERYQQAENAKKQRTIQVMEIHDLPKQGLQQRHQTNAKHRSKLREMLKGRR